MTNDAFQFVQIFYWIALSTWFGAVLFIAIASPVVFKTVTDHRPILPNVLSVNLENQHATLLAGSIVGDLIVRLAKVQLMCATVVAVALIAQGFTTNLEGEGLRSNTLAFVLRVIMFLVATSVVIFDWRVAWPRVVLARGQYIDNADEPDVANPAKDTFDRLQKQTVTLLMIVVAMLLGMIVLSGNITPRSPSVGSTPIQQPTEK